MGDERWREMILTWLLGWPDTSSDFMQPTLPSCDLAERHTLGRAVKRFQLSRQAPMGTHFQAARRAGRDSFYRERGLPPLSPIQSQALPFVNVKIDVMSDFSPYSFTISKNLGGLRGSSTFATATGLI